jgi:hypothetical protein
VRTGHWSNPVVIGSTDDRLATCHLAADADVEALTRAFEKISTPARPLGSKLDAMKRSTTARADAWVHRTGP